MKKSSIEKISHNKWRVRFKGQIFEIAYESFVMFPLSLQGATAFRLEKCKPQDAEDSWEPYWSIRIRADSRSYPDKEILRVVWSHLGRTDGDNGRTLHEYDRLDKFIPEGAIGKPEEMGSGIKRWRVSCSCCSTIVEKYVYIAVDGQLCGSVILVETANDGHKWEISTDYSRYNSLQEAETELLESF